MIQTKTKTQNNQMSDMNEPQKMCEKCNENLADFDKQYCSQKCRTAKLKLINRNKSRHKGKINCKGKQVNRSTNTLEPCREHPPEEIGFCKHHIHMKDYTDDNMKNLTVCSGCRKAYYFANISKRTCDPCLNR